MPSRSSGSGLPRHPTSAWASSRLRAGSATANPFFLSACSAGLSYPGGGQAIAGAAARMNSTININRMMFPPELRRAVLSDAGAVVRNHFQAGQVHVRQATHVNHGHRLAVSALALAEGRDAAGEAEMVVDQVPVELVGAHVRLGRLQAQGLARESREQRALAPTHGAVAIDHIADLAFQRECDTSAVTATF